MFPRQLAAMPLSRFSEQARATIAAQVAAPTPPARYLIASDPRSMIESRAWYEWHWSRGVDPGARRPKISESLRAAVIARDGLVCGICADPVEVSDVHLDHVRPFSHGGPTTLGNLRVAHSRCNLVRGARWDSEAD